MKKLIITLAAFVALAACTGKKENETPKMEQVSENLQKPKEEVKENLLQEVFIVQTDMHLNVGLAEKKHRHTDYMFEQDTVKVMGRTDIWTYKVVKILENDEKHFKILVHGGNLAYPEEYDDLTYTVYKGIVRAERDNGAMWFDVDYRQANSLEKQLNKSGVMFRNR
jgi:hypothetical protein